MRQKSMRVMFLALGTSLGLMAATAAGSTITLQDKNSTVAIDPDSSPSTGVDSWYVNNNVNQLAQQWFWYRIGASGPESSIDALGNMTSSPYFGTRGLSLSYSNSAQGLGVEVDYLLTGGGTSGGNSDLSETISITNTLAMAQTVHFFQYSNFNLESAAQDTLSFSNSNTVAQSSVDSSQRKWS